MDIRVRVDLAHFWKIWLFSSTSAMATTSCCKLTEPCWQWCWQLLEYQDFQKRAKNSLNFPKMCQMYPNTDVQLWNQILIINSDSTHQKLMKFAFIVTGSFFLQWHWGSGRHLQGKNNRKLCMISGLLSWMNRLIFFWWFLDHWTSYHIATCVA